MNITGHNYFSCYSGVRPVLLLLPLLFAAGCASYALDQAQFDIRSGFVSGDYKQAGKELSRFQRKKVYKSKDAVLFNLENGVISHFAGDYKESSRYFLKAESEIESNYTKSISRGVGAFFVNDNKLVYDGEPYEDVYVNAFNALNFIQLQDFDAALVEARRMSFKMEQLDIKIKGLVDAFAKTDTTGQIDWNSSKVSIQNSALSHYLATVLFAKTNKPDDARIEAQKISTAVMEQNSHNGFRQRERPDYSHLLNHTSYNVLLTGFSGQAPIKSQEDNRFLWSSFDGEPENSFYLKFSYPILELYPSKVSRIRVVVDDEETVPLELIEEMDVVSSKVFKAKQSIIYGRAILRAGFKAVASKLISSSVREQNETLGNIFEILGFITQEATEKADLRGWQTLPGAVWMQPIALTAGHHRLRFEYLSERGAILSAQEFEIEVSPHSRLQLVESIYSY